MFSVILVSIMLIIQIKTKIIYGQALSMESDSANCMIQQSMQLHAGHAKQFKMCKKENRGNSHYPKNNPPHMDRGEREDYSPSVIQPFIYNFRRCELRSELTFSFYLKIPGFCEERRTFQKSANSEIQSGFALGNWQDTMLEVFWWISLYVTYDAIAKLYVT